MSIHFWIGASKGLAVLACSAKSVTGNMNPSFVTCEKCKQQDTYLYGCIAMDNTNPAEFSSNISTWALKVKSAMNHRTDITVDLTRKPPVTLERKGS